MQWPTRHWPTVFIKILTLGSCAAWLLGHRDRPADVKEIVALQANENKITSLIVPSGEGSSEALVFVKEIAAKREGSERRKVKSLMFKFWV